MKYIMIQNIGDVNWMQIIKANCINLGIMGKFSIGAVYNGKNSDKYKYRNTNTQIQIHSSHEEVLPLSGVQQ